MPILRLRRVAPEQLVSLTVEVAHLAPVKTINTQYGSTLKKQELVARDTSGSIKLILWQEYVESLQESKTYRLQNVRVKISKDETYINRAKSEQFGFEEVEAFDGDLPPVHTDLKACPRQWFLRVLVQTANADKKDPFKYVHGY